MARRKSYKGRNRGGGGGGGGRDTRDGPRGWAAVEKKNEAFEKYYNDLFSEEEAKEMWAAMRRELPHSFRFTGSKGHALTVQQQMIDRYIPTITSVTYNDQPVDPPRQLEWYPDRVAWSMTTPKQVIRRFPPFASFQKFLVSETTVGNISRQEVVSMIPPLFMDIKPGMTVLDLCAAPGSKTAQLLEMLHGGEEARVRRVVRKVAEQEGREVSPDGAEIEAEASQADSEEDWSDDGRSTGLLIANDMDWKRAQLLIHQTKRLNSPNLIVTNHDARHYPSILLETDGKKSKYMKFDRILADVPCTGDGTARKNVNVWKDWTYGNGLNLYGMQALILLRALQMLKVGGRVVYSTCSMNPIENEAVISSVIDRCGGPSAVEIIDCSERYPELIRRPGLKTWNVVDREGRKWNTWSQTKEAYEQQGEDLGKLVEGMYPLDLPEEEKSPLERCMRVYPHLQDTGAFFITVLEKKSEIKRLRDPPSQRNASATEATAPEPVSEKTANGVPQETQEKPNGTEEDAKPIAEDKLESTTTNQEAPEVKSEPTETKPELAEAKHATAVTTEDGSQPVNNTEGATVPRSPKRRLEDDDEQNDNTDAQASKRLKTEDGTPSAAATTQKANGKKSGQTHEEPFKYLDPNHEEVTGVFDFYGIASRFPRDRFMVRNASGNPAKSMYYTSALARQILQLNEGSGIKFVHCGVKMFVKQDAQGQDICRWRIQSEGLPIIEPWVGESRIVRLYKRSTLKKLLVEMFPRVIGDSWKELGEIGERARDISMGCCVLRVETSDDPEEGFKERMVLPLWRSMSSLNLMLPKEERRAMLLRVYNDESPLIDQHAKYREAKAAQEAAAAHEDADSDIIPGAEEGDDDLAESANPSAEVDEMVGVEDS